MNQKSFNKAVSIVTLVFFLGTPIGVFAQDSVISNPQAAPPATFNDSGPSGAVVASQSGCANGRCGAGASGLGAAGGLGGLFGGSGGGANGLLGGLAIGSLMGGGLGGGGGGGGATGAVSQALTLAGALTGNMGLMLAGMITGMLGGLAGGAGATPQRGAVDEQYVAPGQAGPGGGYGSGYGNGYGGSNYNPYYTTPTPRPTVTPAPAASCEKTIFIVKDTTATPNTVRPYPSAVEIPQNQCVLAINSDTSASHSVQVKEQDAVKATQSIDKEKSHIFRFENKKTYTLCVDAVATACTTVTVK